MLVTNRRRAVLLGPLGVAFLALAASSVRLALDAPSGSRMADLNVYLGAVHAVQHGTPLYDYAAANGDLFTYPPFALLVFWPFAGLPLGFVQVLWTLATVAAAVAIAAALTRRAGIQGRQRAAIATLTAALVLLHSAPLNSNLRLGQVSVFVILLGLLDALDLVPRRFSGGLIGL
ncbi:MAG TPA: glycosyltransferase 87 family protein, partial [Jatrophihabitantaceae bacterium]|nr:glycosyltransferase 87 family protein [Jatrophihabitantaceae bacterium]